MCMVKSVCSKCGNGTGKGTLPDEYFILGEKVSPHIFIFGSGGEQISSGIGNIGNWRGLKGQYLKLKEEDWRD